MAAPIKSSLLTTEQLLALPHDGIERWLIQGQLREKPRTVRNRTHSRILAKFVYLLQKWLKEPRGQVLCGEAGCILRRNPDTTVGIDVVHIAANLAQQESTETTLIDGVPVLAIEIHLPSDMTDEIDEKIDDHPAARVALVWFVDAHDQTVEIYRNGTAPKFVNIHQELNTEPHRPGFRVAVKEIFA